MNVLEAKEFLVQQTVEQARIENVPLSDLEQRMMYFTETGECPEDPLELNNAFAAKYDSNAYERKISRLMSHARQRLKGNNTEKLLLWDEAFRILGKGDHYILVLRPRSSARKSPQIWRTYVFGILALVGAFALKRFFFGSGRDMRSGQQPPAEKYLPAISPLAEHLLQFLFLLALVFAIFPQPFFRLVTAIRRLIGSASSSEYRE